MLLLLSLRGKVCRLGYSPVRRFRCCSCRLPWLRTIRFPVRLPRISCFCLRRWCSICGASRCALCSWWCLLCSTGFSVPLSKSLRSERKCTSFWTCSWTSLRWAVQVRSALRAERQCAFGCGIAEESLCLRMRIVMFPQLATSSSRSFGIRS